MLFEQADALRQSLRENKYKLTRPRQTLLDIVARADHHLTPAEVYHQAKARYPHLGLTTVYRTLDLLLDLGYVQRIHLDEGCHSYAPTARPHGHQIICSSCGRTEEFAGCDLGPLIKTLQSRTGFKINAHVLELMGCCPDCQSARPARAAPTRAKKDRRG